MIYISSRYYGEPFKMFCGVTQGYQLYPKIFNVVVNVVIRCWLTIMEKETSGPEGFDC